MQISSAIFESECNLWDINKTIFSDFIFCKTDKKKCSVFLSIADVDSSNISNLGFLNNARANEISCFCPPDKLTPSSPTRVYIPCAIG